MAWQETQTFDKYEAKDLAGDLSLYLAELAVSERVRLK
jgi:hypothetical protein